MLDNFGLSGPRRSAQRCIAYLQENADDITQRMNTVRAYEILHGYKLNVLHLRAFGVPYAIHYR